MLSMHRIQNVSSADTIVCAFLAVSFCLLTEIKLVLATDCSLPSELKHPAWGNDMVLVCISVNLAGFHI